MRFEAFKLAQFYMFGRPSALLQDAPQQQIELRRLPLLLCVDRSLAL